VTTPTGDDRASGIASLIKRVLQWLVCLVDRRPRIKATARMQGTSVEDTAWAEHSGDDAVESESQTQASKGNGGSIAAALDETSSPQTCDGVQVEAAETEQPPRETTQGSLAPSGAEVPQPHPIQAVAVRHEAISSQGSQVSGTSEASVPVTPTDDQQRSEGPSDHNRQPPDRKRELRQRPSIAPEDRGGRSRISRPVADNEREQKRKPHTPKPEIVCWKREREWILAVELSDALSENQGVTIVQGNKPLVEDESQRGCWHLAQLRGDVTVRILEADAEKSFPIPLGDDGYLVFKLSGGDLRQGRRVRRVSSGSYLTIVLATWERDEEKAGRPRQRQSLPA
jgi:hypothetical protein